MIESALVAILTTAAGAIPAAIAAGSIFPNAAPQGTPLATPCLIYSLVVAEHQASYGGSSGLCCGHYQVTCRSPKYASTKALAEAVRKSLDARTEGDGGDIQAVIIDGETDIYEPPIDKSDVGQHCVHFDVSIWYAEDNC